MQLGCHRDRDSGVRVVDTLELTIGVKEVVREEDFGLHDIDGAAGVLREGRWKTLQSTGEVCLLLSQHLWIVRELRAEEIDDPQQDSHALASAWGLREHSVQKAVYIQEKSELGSMPDEVLDPITCNYAHYKRAPRIVAGDVQTVRRIVGVLLSPSASLLLLPHGIRIVQPERCLPSRDGGDSGFEDYDFILEDLVLCRPGSVEILAIFGAFSTNTLIAGGTLSVATLSNGSVVNVHVK